MTQEYFNKLGVYARDRMEKGKATALVFDTLSKLSYNAYTAEKGKLNYDKWRDYGLEYYDMYEYLIELGFEVVQVLGEYGTGKSFSLKFFEEKEFIWFNIDNKNPTWKGGRQVLGTKQKPRPGYNLNIIKTYEDAKAVAKLYMDLGIFAERPIAFLFGHIQDYKSGDLDNPIKQQLKVMGNQAKELGVEGLVENTIYSKVVVEDGGVNYYFVTKPNGANTIRTLEGLFEETLIPNNLKLVTDKIRSY